MKKIFNYIHAKYQYFKYSRKYENNKIYLINPDGTKKQVSPSYYIKNFEIVFRGNNNEVFIKMPQRMHRCILQICSNNNKIYIGKNNSGKYNFRLIGNDNSIKIGENNTSSGFSAILNDSHLVIGNNCMFSNSIKLWTDGHSVIDKDTKELLNPSGKTIKIGNHVWIGENVTLLKRTNIPDNCIVAHSSIVTKEFTEENCIYAGNPARAVKHNINWTEESPKEYNNSPQKHL